MSIFLDKKLESLEPYTPGEQPEQGKYIKLNTNENPYFPSKYAIDTVDKQQLEKLRLYSDPDSRELSAVIAAYYGVNVENVLTTNGSDEALAFCFSAFCGHGAVFPDITYGFYKVFAGLFGVGYSEIPLADDFTVDVRPYLDCGKTVILANPNAQTGILLGRDEIERIIKSNPRNAVVIDEAYVDFGGQSLIPLIKKYNNLVVVQTFSKSRSLAGARVGFAVADKELIGDLKRVKFSFNPYNVNRISGALAAEAMRDKKYFSECVGKIIENREKLSDGLRRAGFEVLPSTANFILAKNCKTGGRELYESLKNEGILVRHFPDRRINDYIRITVGKEEECVALLEKIRKITEA